MLSRDALDGGLRDATVMTVVLALAFAWVLSELAKGTSHVVHGLLVDYDASSIEAANANEPLSFAVGGRLMTLVTALIELAVIAAVAAAYFHRRRILIEPLHEADGNALVRLKTVRVSGSGGRPQRVTCNRLCVEGGRQKRAVGCPRRRNVQLLPLAVTRLAYSFRTRTGSQHLHSGFASHASRQHSKQKSLNQTLSPTRHVHLRRIGHRQCHALLRALTGR
jgi:hypothetical protein